MASWSRSSNSRVERPRSAVLAVATAAVLAAIAIGGCGGSDEPTNRIHGETLTIYSSGPMRGASRFDAAAVLDGEKLALAQARGHVGKYRIDLKPLDDSTVQRDGWDPGTTTINARTATQNPSTIGYLGEFNSGASAVSIPLLNRFGIPQVSPTSSAVGLTSGAAGAAPGEPQKYYPTNIRTFARVVPNDTIQAGVQVKLQQSMGCQKTYVLDDGEVDGEDLADTFQLVARSQNLDVIGLQAFQRRAATYAPLATSIARTGANCVLISALTESGAPLLVRQIAAAMPHASIFCSDGVAESTFTEPAQGGIPLSLDSRVLVTAPTLGGAAEPPAAKNFYAAFGRRYGLAQPDAIYGYEAMNLLLGAISQASDDGRHSVLRSHVLDALFESRVRQSVLGSYSITRQGDTTIRRYGVYRIVGGALEYWKALGG